MNWIPGSLYHVDELHGSFDFEGRFQVAKPASSLPVPFVHPSSTHKPGHGPPHPPPLNPSQKGAVHLWDMFGEVPLLWVHTQPHLTCKPPSTHNLLPFRSLTTPQDGAVRLWDMFGEVPLLLGTVPSRQAVVALSGHSASRPVTTLEFAWEQGLLIIGHEGGEVSVWGVGVARVACRVWGAVHFRHCCRCHNHQACDFLCFDV